MPFRSHIMAAGNSPNSAATITGGGSRTQIVAVGTNQATALQSTNSWNSIGTSSASTGIKLVTCEEGAQQGFINLSGQTITFYPHETSGVTINNTTSYALANNGVAVFIAYADNAWMVNKSA